MANEYKKFNETKLSNFQSRYGEAIPDNDYPTNDFIENILVRRTVRSFLHKPIDPKLLEKLIACAQSSPTSSMLQPWSIIMIESVEQKAKLFQGENKHHMGTTAPYSDPTNFNAVMECAVFIIWLVDCTLMDKIFTNDTVRDLHPDLTDLRQIAYDSARHSTFEIRSISDTIIAAQTFVLCAESMGLGTMYCGSIKTMDLQHTFNIPERAMPLFGLCVGYPSSTLDPERPIYTKPRITQNYIVHREQYQEKNFEDITLYNKLLELFYKTQNLSYDWFYRVIKRTQISRINKTYRSLIDKYGFKLK